MQILFIGRLISLLTVVAIAVGVGTSAVPRGSTVEPAAAELPFARSRDGVRETYIVSFGLFGPESVFASEAQKAAQILRARLQAEAQVLVRFNDKRGGNATSAARRGSSQRGSSYGRGEGHLGRLLDLPWEPRRACCCRRWSQ